MSRQSPHLSDVLNVLPRQNINPNQHPSPTPETSNNVTHLSHTWRSVVTPICSKTLKILLMGYPHQDAHYLVSGFEEGFRLGYEGPREHRMSNNVQSAYQLPDVVDKKLSKEVSLGRIAPIGEAPKKEEGQFRLIHHLSYPSIHSVNDHIPGESKSVSYATVDDAVRLIVLLGRSCNLAKCDIDSAYRNIPVNYLDYELLGINWKNQFYFDRCLAMGLGSSCSIFEKIFTALQWIAQNRLNIRHMIHTLDDFLFVGPANSNVCEESLRLFLNLCKTLGVPIKNEKNEHSCTFLVFLGIELDSVLVEARLPDDKIRKIEAALPAMTVRKGLLYVNFSH